MEISDQEKLLNSIAKILSDLDIDYFIAGGIAVSVWGRPRATFDIDIIVKIAESKAAPLAKAFKKISEAGYADEEMAKDAIRNKGEFNFIDPSSGLKVDFWVTKEDKASLQEFENKKLKRINNHDIYFISPEDLIISKLLWRKQGGGEKHIDDAESVLNISGEMLDMDYLNKQATKSSVLEELKELVEKSKP